MEARCTKSTPTLLQLPFSYLGENNPISAHFSR